MPKKWGFRTVVLEKNLEGPLDSKEIKPVNPRGNQPWIFIVKTDIEPEVPILWPLDVNSQSTGKDYDAGKGWGQEKRAREDEMVGWHHWLSSMSLSKLRELCWTRKRVVLQLMGSQSQTWPSSWTTTTSILRQTVNWKG